MTDGRPTPGNELPGELDIRDDDAVMFDGFPVGVLDAGVLTLNLGWCRLAGLSLRVEDDPSIDHHRDGVALERTVPRRSSR